MTRRGIVDGCLAFSEPSRFWANPTCSRRRFCFIVMLYHKIMHIVSVITVLLNVLIDVTIVYKYQIINEGDRDRLEGSPEQSRRPH